MWTFCAFVLLCKFRTIQKRVHQQRERRIVLLSSTSIMLSNVLVLNTLIKMSKLKINFNYSTFWISMVFIWSRILRWNNERGILFDYRPILKTLYVHVYSQKNIIFLSYRVNPFMQYFERTSLLQQVKKLISKGFNWNEKTLLKQNLLNIKILLGII